MTTVKLLKKAMSLIQDPSKHLTDEYFNSDFTKFCAIGALRYASGYCSRQCEWKGHDEDKWPEEAMEFLYNAAGGEMAVRNANDGPNGHARVLEIYQRAITQAEEFSSYGR